jgi:hypothetical protein
MGFLMWSLTRTKSGAWFSRKGISHDMRDECAALHGSRWEELFGPRRQASRYRRKVDHSEWEAKIESRIAAIRAKQRGEGHVLRRPDLLGLRRR